jgi:radical SAM superfamily enzyme YgiQ (UPF0313 family)
MKIFLTHSYFLKFDPKQFNIGQPYAPIGTLYAASVLRKNGYNVHFYDTMFCTSPTDIIGELNAFKPDLFLIYDDGFNYLTKMCLTNMRDAAFEMIQLAKFVNAKVLVSSSDSTDHFKTYLNRGADYIIKGEGEQTLLETISTIRDNRIDFSSISGLSYFENSIVKSTPPRTVVRDLDSIPFPAWDLINIEPYRNMWMNSSGYFSMNMTTTRGCPYKCNWCAKPIYGNRYNSRSPQNVIDELLLMKQKFNFSYIWFCDDIFGLKPGWVNEFSELLNNNNLKIKFKIQSRVDLLLHDNQLKALADSGCDTIWVGAESGSQKILDAMEKGTKVEQIYEATELMKKNGIKPAFFLQFGYPGETIDDINLTIKMLNDLLPEDIGISISYPLPGTKFYDNVKEQLKQKANWTDSDDLSLMFNNAYSPAFYKQLHRYVHKNYRNWQGIASLKNLFKGNFVLNYKSLKSVFSPIYFAPASYFAKVKLKSLA